MEFGSADTSVLTMIRSSALGSTAVLETCAAGRRGCCSARNDHCQKPEVPPPQSSPNRIARANLPEFCRRTCLVIPNALNTFGPRTP